MEEEIVPVAIFADGHEGAKQDGESEEQLVKHGKEKFQWEERDRCGEELEYHEW